MIGSYSEKEAPPLLVLQGAPAHCHRLLCLQESLLITSAQGIQNRLKKPQNLQATLKAIVKMFRNLTFGPESRPQQALSVLNAVFPPVKGREKPGLCQIPGLHGLQGAVSILQPVVVMLEEILHILTPCPDKCQSHSWSCHHK